MSMTTRNKTIISGAVAGLAMLGLTAVPAIAHNHDQVTKSTIAVNHGQSTTPRTSGATQTQVQATPTPAQMNQKMQQMNQMMERCNSMMSKMQNMRGSGDMPEMMNNPNSQPGQGRMNRTLGQ